MYDIFDMQAGDYRGVVDTTGFDAGRLERERADEHYAVMDANDRVLARCSIWWRDAPVVGQGTAGAIGHYAALDAEAAGLLLDFACRQLKQRRCSLALGPLDGSTWRRYRFVTERGHAKPFFMEPDNPDEWPAHFAGAGFGSYARYVSELNDNFPIRQPEIGDLPQRFARAGVTIEQLDLSGPATDLSDIHAVACAAFTGSPLFTPIDFDEFAAIYAPLLTSVDPRLMLIARHEGRIVGFVFAPPDYLQSLDPAAIDTIVIKTVAVLPDACYRGLGRMLIVDMLRNAESMGYRQAISALMYCENRSQQISRDCARPMREYRLFARELAA
ncbi:MAG: GNAT family N-acetyltransferase [Gammaproteobacteria bacterium]|nr:GNAT family N-acetyltransferase [Gammaproteobacteria bacterium]MDH4255818.1 GNAT family N-acetyltransferase [Gammaproteobacteria bacterium]MDH5310348.1 GNAT family N-acetyltransferase [Gammaproteobacteria bacterium]